MICNRFLENNSDFHTYEEENIIEANNTFNDIKKFYWIITFIVFGIYYYSILYSLSINLIL